MRDIIPVEAKEEPRNQWWYFVAAGVVLLALILYLAFRRRPKLQASTDTAVDAYEHARKKLEELQRQKPPSKLYYSSLTSIFRVYVAERRNIHSLQQTTDDLMVRLRSLYPGNPVFEKLAQALRLADFVKFAKYVPAGNDDQMAFDAVSAAIDEIERKPDAV
jgi:hypothetical protein